MTVVLADTEVVVTGKLALVEPLAIVTLAGTDAAELLVESRTSTPPALAGELIVTVPDELLPPVTLAGLSVTPVTQTSPALVVALTLSGTVVLDPP